MFQRADHRLCSILLGGGFFIFVKCQRLLSEDKLYVYSLAIGPGHDVLLIAIDI